MYRNLGFTLLEVLIALFIFTIVSMMMVGGLRIVTHSQMITEKKAARLNELQLALIIIAKELEQTINRPITNAKHTLEAAFIGTPVSIRFTHGGATHPVNELQRSSLQRAHYFLEKQNLIRETWPVLDQTAKTQSTQRILLQGVTELRFEYLDNEGHFHNNWPPAAHSEIALPQGIRIYLSLENWGKISQLYLIKTGSSK